MYYLYFDGGSRGNPGIAGSGAVVYDNEMKEIASTTYECGDDKTNNHAEYMGLFKGIELVHSMQIKLSDLVIRGDSMLVIKQCNGEWKVREPGLQTIMASLLSFLQSTGSFNHKVSDYFKDMQHVRRNDNARADQLSNVAMDSLASKLRLRLGLPA